MAIVLLIYLAVLRPVPQRTLRHLALWVGEVGPPACLVHTIWEWMMLNIAKATAGRTASDTDNSCGRNNGMSESVAGITSHSI